MVATLVSGLNCSRPNSDAAESARDLRSCGGAQGVKWRQCQDVVVLFACLICVCGQNDVGGESEELQQAPTLRLDK